MVMLGIDKVSNFREDCLLDSNKLPEACVETLNLGCDSMHNFDTTPTVWDFPTPSISDSSHIPWDGGSTDDSFSENNTQHGVKSMDGIQLDSYDILQDATQILKSVKMKYNENIVVAQLNINSIRNKFDQLLSIIQRNVDILVITETKLDYTFPNSQFEIDGYSAPFRLDRINTNNTNHNMGGGILVFVREDIPSKELKGHRLPDDIEALPIEINLRKTKFLLLATYHPPSQSDAYFFGSLTKILDTYAHSYEKVLLAGDFNSQDHELRISNFMSEHNLKNIVKSPTCFKSLENPTCIDLFITNFANSFQSTKTVSTGLSDFHKMVLTVLKNKFVKIKPKEVEYRCYKTVNREIFRYELSSSLSGVSSLEEFNDIYLSLLNVHAPIKKKTVRINQAPYMTKTLRKAIMKRSALKNKFYREKTLITESMYKKQRNFCSRLYKKEKKKFYNNLNMKSFTDNKMFWKTVKPFLSEKGNLSKKINLVEQDEVVSEDIEVAEILNTYFSESVNNLEIKENNYIVNSCDHISDPINKALHKFDNHPSILKIRGKVNGVKFKFSPVTLGKLEREINSLNPKKANTSNSIPSMNLKENIDVIVNVLHNIINEDIVNSHFPDKLKLAEILPLLKYGDVTNKEKYRPISILPSISKIYERIMQCQISGFIEVYLYQHMCGYRKKYSTQYALMLLIEKWKRTLDNHGYAGAIITDLSKAFDTINHELLLAKLHAYGFETQALKMIRNYLTNRWYKTKINTSFSTWKKLLSGVPQGSVLGPLLFNIYFNDLFYFLEETEAANYADDTNIYACDMDLGNLMRRLEHDSIISMEWFESNYMKLNGTKCHFLIAGNKYEHLWLNVGQSQIWETQSEKILGVTIDNKLKFEEHVENILVKAGKKLSALARMSHILSFSKLRLLMKSFVESQFSYCPLVWMFYSRSLNNRINKLQERSLRILYRDDISSFEDLLIRDNSITVHECNIKLLATEMYKVENNILPNLGEFFKKRELRYNLRNQSGFVRDKANTTHYGTESITILGPKIWDIIPSDIKNAGTLNSFKINIKKWKVENCPCRLCKTFVRDLGFL